MGVSVLCHCVVVLLFQCDEFVNFVDVTGALLHCELPSNDDLDYY